MQAKIMVGTFRKSRSVDGKPVNNSTIGMDRIIAATRLVTIRSGHNAKILTATAVMDQLTPSCNTPTIVP
jgi:hypothetical protein